MTKALSLINGIGRMITINAFDSFYDDKYTFAVDTSSGTNITLPNTGTYSNVELRVFLMGQFLEVGQDYAYVGSIPRTQIQLLQDMSSGNSLRFRINSGSVPASIYDQVVTGSNITAGTAITLPLSKTYSDSETEVYLNGQLLENIIDYLYVGIVPRTQITLTFDLYSIDRLRFRSGD